MQVAIDTITDAPDTIAPKSQEEQTGEQNKAKIADTEESNPITKEGPEGNGQDKTQANSLLSSFGSQILYWLKLFPEQVPVKQIEVRLNMDSSSLKTTDL